MEHLGRCTCGARHRVLPLKQAQRRERDGRCFLGTTRASWFSFIVPNQLVGKPPIASSKESPTAKLH